MENNELRYYKDEAEYYRNQIEFSKKYYGAPNRSAFSALKDICHKFAAARARKREARRERAQKRALSVPVDGLNHEKREEQIVVSLTSFPARIGGVAAVVGSLLRQTLKPDKILLYLAGEQFPDRALPKELARLRDLGLVEILFCEDLRPHKKYFYAMQEYPDAVLVTVDDDVLYRPTLLEELHRSYERFPACVSCTRAHKMRFDRQGNLLPYWDWIHEYHYAIGVPSHRLLATGVGGVLYPPRCFSEEAFDAPLIKELCLSADDLWLKTMEVRHGRKVVLCADSAFKLEELPSARESALLQDNLQSGNDRQFAAILKHFGMHLAEYMDEAL